MAEDTLFVARRDTPPEWVEELNRLVPRQENAPWLRLHWMAGQDYEPVGRWVLYEMDPLVDEDRVNPLILGALRGPRPDKEGHWKSDTVPGGRRWISHSLVSQAQWDLFHETRCIPFLFWIIQGTNGGHRWRLSAIEERFAKAMVGEEFAWPAPGDLAYAPFDRRVTDQVQRIDRMRTWERLMVAPREMKTTNAGLFILDSDRRAEREFSTEMQKYLAEQIDGAVSNMTATDVSNVMSLARSDLEGFGADVEDVSRALTEATTI